jgi:hypothetical protein
VGNKNEKARSYMIIRRQPDAVVTSGRLPPVYIALRHASRPSSQRENEVKVKQSTK